MPSHSMPSTRKRALRLTRVYPGNDGDAARTHRQRLTQDSSCHRECRLCDTCRATRLVAPSRYRTAALETNRFAKLQWWPRRYPSPSLQKEASGFLGGTPAEPARLSSLSFAKMTRVADPSTFSLQTCDNALCHRKHTRSTSAQPGGS